MGSTVGPIINKVIEDSLDVLNVLKDYNGVEREYTWMDEKYYTVGYTSLSRYFNELIMLDTNKSIWMEVCIKKEIKNIKKEVNVANI